VEIEVALKEKAVVKIMEAAAEAAAVQKLV
jgi:hypothetical protein